MGKSWKWGRKRKENVSTSEEGGSWSWGGSIRVCQKLRDKRHEDRMGRLPRIFLLSRRKGASHSAWLDKAGTTGAFSYYLNFLTKFRLLPKEHAPIHNYWFEAGITCSSILVLVRLDVIPLLVLVTQGHFPNIFLLVHCVHLLSWCL